MDSYRVYRKFVIIIFIIGLLWAAIEFSGLFMHCTDWCGVEWIFILPVIAILTLVLGIWSLVRKVASQNSGIVSNEHTTGSVVESKKIVLFLPILIPFLYPLIDFISSSSYEFRSSLVSFYLEYFFILVLTSFTSIAIGTFLKGKIRLISLCVLLSMELCYLIEFIPHFYWFGLSIVGQILFICIAPILIYFTFKAR